MQHIKSFIDRVSQADRQSSVSVILSIQEARAVRDELAKILADLANRPSDAVTRVEIRGGTW